MAKTKEQVFKYVSFRKYSDEDWDQISKWITKHYGKGLHRPRHPKTESNKEEFFDWHSKNCLAEGDIVIGKEYMGIFHELPNRIEDGVFEIVGWYDKEGVLHKNDGKELSYKDFNAEWQIADSEVAESYRQRLYNDGYVFAVSLGRLAKRKLPEINEVFRFEYNDKRGMAIIDSYMDKAAHILISLTDKIERDYWLNTSQLNILQFGKKDYEMFVSTLEQNGICWDKYTHQLITHIKRATKGSLYWYINDRFGINSSRENDSKADRERFVNRNYFVNYREALRFRDKIYHLRADII